MMMTTMTTIMASCPATEANASGPVVIEDVTMTYRPSDAKALRKDHIFDGKARHILVEAFGW